MEEGQARSNSCSTGKKGNMVKKEKKVQKKRKKTKKKKKQNVFIRNTKGGIEGKTL